MKLGELLDHTGKQYLDDRTDLLDGEPDELWSDATLVRFFNEAQRILCRRAWVIVETGVAPAGVITLVTGKVLYPLHKSVLRVYDGTPTTQAAPVGRADDVILRDPVAATNLDAFDRGNAAALAGTASHTGATLAVATDAGTKTVRIWPPPAAAQNGVQVLLKVARLPICLLDAAKPDAEPEIPEEYHLWLADYAASECLKMPNNDGQSKADGRELRAQFDANVKQARQDRQRAEYNGDRWAFNTTTSEVAHALS